MSLSTQEFDNPLWGRGDMPRTKNTKDNPGKQLDDEAVRAIAKEVINIRLSDDACRCRCGCTSTSDPLSMHCTKFVKQAIGLLGLDVAPSVAIVTDTDIDVLILLQKTRNTIEKVRDASGRINILHELIYGRDHSVVARDIRLGLLDS